MISRLKKYHSIFFGHLFFLFNTAGLPAPLMYTNMASILGLKNLMSKKSWIAMAIFSAISLAYAGIHIAAGVELKSYIQTFVFMQLIVFTTIVSANYMLKNKEKLPKVFQWLAWSGFGLFLISLLIDFAFSTPFFWMRHDFSIGGGILRYKGLGYESSFYALAISPIIIYFGLKLIYKGWKNNWIPFILALIPVLFTLSFGFIGALAIGAILAIILVAIYHRHIKTSLLISIAAVALFGFIAMNTINFLSERVDRIIAGTDTSVNGRTNEAFSLAKETAEKKSLWFGVGLGQIKIIGDEVIRSYYNGLGRNYSKENMPVVTIPNTSAETLAIYGVSGLMMRMAVELFFFFKFKVFNNYFSLFLFSFLFVYQLMGSFITSTTEYTLWAMSFIPIFDEFNIVSSPKFKLL